MYKKILVPTDGSEAAEKEVEKVGDLVADDGDSSYQLHKS